MTSSSFLPSEIVQANRKFNIERQEREVLFMGSSSFWLLYSIFFPAPSFYPTAGSWEVEHISSLPNKTLGRVLVPRIIFTIWIPFSPILHLPTKHLFLLLTWAAAEERRHMRNLRGMREWIKKLNNSRSTKRERERVKMLVIDQGASLQLQFLERPVENNKSLLMRKTRTGEKKKKLVMLTTHDVQRCRAMITGLPLTCCF